MNRTRVVLIASVLVCGVIAWVVAIVRGRVTEETLGLALDSSATAPMVDTDPSSEPQADQDAGHEAMREPPMLDKAKRDAMREAIYRAWGMDPPSERTNPATWPTAPSAKGEGFGKDYIRQRIRDDYIPLARDCYQQGLKKNPTLAGRLVASFRIVGTKGTGGLVDWVDTASEENTLDDADVIECLKQSMYSVTFDPPPNDGVVTVTYPLTFSNVEPDGGD